MTILQFKNYATGDFMKISIHGYGGELVVGTITREQYVYWSMQDESELESHVLGDSELDEVDESLHLGEWYDLDNIEHLNGASYDETTQIIIEDDQGKDILSVPITHFENAGSINWESGFDAEESEYEFAFMAYSAEKGCFGGLIVPDNNFDPKKLSFTVRQVDGIRIVDGMYYDHPDAVDSDEYSTSGKNWECWLLTKQNAD